MAPSLQHGLGFIPIVYVFLWILFPWKVIIKEKSRVHFKYLYSYNIQTKLIAVAPAQLRRSRLEHRLGEPESTAAPGHNLAGSLLSDHTHLFTEITITHWKEIMRSFIEHQF